MYQTAHVSWIFQAITVLVLVLFAICIGWVLPILIGVDAAKRKNYSPRWMWFAIHPLFGWIACIVLLCLTPRVRCPHCGGYPQAYFLICPYCHAGLDNPSGPGSHPSPS